MNFTSRQKLNSLSARRIVRYLCLALGLGLPGGRMSGWSIHGPGVHSLHSHGGGMIVGEDPTIIPHHLTPVTTRRRRASH